MNHEGHEGHEDQNHKSNSGLEPMDHVAPELEQLAFDTIGAAIEVHRELGPGLLESVYENAMAVELSRRQIPYQQQVPATVQYKKVDVGEARIDLLIDDRLIVELKAVESFTDIHQAQIMSYLKITELPLGLLLNFNTTKLKDGGIKRIITA